MWKISGMFTVKWAITSLGQARKPHHLLNCCEEKPTWCGKTKLLTVTVIITVTVCGLVFHTILVFPHNTLTFHGYFWCLQFCAFQSKPMRGEEIFWMNPNDTSLQSKVYNFVNLTLCVVGAWVAVSKENKTAINLARLFLRPIWPSRIPLTMYFDGRGTLKRKWRRLVFFSRMAFFPIYPTAGLLPDHELREVLKSRKITISGSKSIRDLK